MSKSKFKIQGANEKFTIWTNDDCISPEIRKELAWNGIYYSGCHAAMLNEDETKVMIGTGDDGQIYFHGDMVFNVEYLPELIAEFGTNIFTKHAFFYLNVDDEGKPSLQLCDEVLTDKNCHSVYWIPDWIIMLSTLCREEFE